MKRKSLYIAALILLFTVPGLWAGGSRQSGGTVTVDRSNFNALGTYPLVKNKETITILTHTSGLEVDLDQFWQTISYEAKTNVHVNWYPVPSDQYKERVNLALASAEKIDLIMGQPFGSSTAFSQSELLRLANQGLILPIGDYFDSDTVNIKKNLNSVDGYRAAVTLPNGKIYHIPELEECLHCAYFGKMWVNKTFLKNVGITKYPETTAEFKAMLIAFRDKDANGNGNPNDEIPLIGGGDYSSALDTYLMNAFGVYSDGENRLYLDKKKVNAAYQQPAFREGLKYLNDLFKERLISRDSFSSTTNRNQLNSQKYESVIGATPFMHHWILGQREEGQPARWLDYEAIPPLKRADGKQVARYDPYLKFRLQWIGTIVPETCKNPALIVRWLDYYHTFDGAMSAIQGGKGIGWDDPDPGAIGTGGGKAVWKQLTISQGDRWYDKNTYNQLPPTFRQAVFWEGQQSVPADTPDGSGIEAYLFQISKKNYQPYGDISLVVPPLWYAQEDISEMSQLTTSIKTCVEENIAKFIIGDLDPNKDADWNAFQTQLRNLNIVKYLQIVQKAYDASAFSK